MRAALGRSCLTPCTAQRGSLYACTWAWVCLLLIRVLCCACVSSCSAVDQHTAIHIFNKCIRGMLKSKAVLWITHQLELLPQCDKIAVMEDGVMTYFGPYNADVLNQRLPVDHLLFATVEVCVCVRVRASAPAC